MHNMSTAKSREVSDGKPRPMPNGAMVPTTDRANMTTSKRLRAVRTASPPEGRGDATASDCGGPRPPTMTMTP